MDQEQNLRQQNILQRLRFIILIKDIETAELILTASTYWWAYTFVSPDPATIVLPFYSNLTEIFPNYVWAILWWFLSIILSIGLVLGSYRIRRTALLFAAFAWIYTGILLILAPLYSVWSGQAIIFGLTAIWGYIRLRLTNEPLESFLEV